MRAITAEAPGATPRLSDVARPEPGPNQVLVQIQAAGYNPFDLLVATGAVDVGAKFPLILGVDAAGVIVARGDQVTSFRVGERVFGQFAHFASGLGSYGEYGVVAQFGGVARMPDSMSFATGAALPVATVAALDLVSGADPQPGQVVLVNGATGGVGQSVTQLANNLGATVIASVTADTRQLLTELGASETVDHQREPVAAAVRERHPGGVDIVIDVVSTADTIEPLADLVRPGGVILSTRDALDVDALAKRNVRAVNLSSETNQEKLAEIARLVDAGKLRVVIEREVPLAQAPAVLATIKNGAATGKTVFAMGS
jgi:NADPH:quinone reductase-like Zn-dependent oxidoreductase